MEDIGKTTLKVLLAIINAYYDESNGYSHCSVTEINKKYGIAKNNIPKLFKKLEEEGWIEDCTVSGYYKKFKIIKAYPCPNFIEIEELSNPQKNFLLRCLEIGVTENTAKKEIARRLYNNETNNNITRSFNAIETACGKTVYQILNNIKYISGLIPEDTEYTQFGYRTTLNRKERTYAETEEDKIAKYLYGKSLNRFKRATNISDYTLTEEIIKEQLIKQNKKDYYTGIEPEDYNEYSVDRIDSSKGYVEGNIVITTNIINIMKQDLTTEQFKQQIQLLYNNIDNF